jgi:hypothetical protein
MNDKLLLLLQEAGRKNYEFHYTMNEDEYNLITVNEDTKIVTVDIGLPESEDIPKIVDDALTILK